ncbi:MAG: hypothetical protein RL701_2555 [Pseudomonadota bacterium]
MNKRIAIACQGGGSQCAFVAGALKTFFQRGADQDFDVVGFSGTSGGAITAALAWFGMLDRAQGGTTPVEERIMACWRDLTAQTSLEILLDSFCIQLVRMVESGMLPTIASSPSAPAFKLWSKAASLLIGRPEYTDLRALLTKHLHFDNLHSLVTPDSPVLLVSAADVCEGSFKIFSSAHDEIQIQSILASAAIPNLFPATWVDGHAYWDGIFSSNPPVSAFFKRAYTAGAFPQEIWVLQVNRSEHAFVPERPSDISDRRNHLAGNLSLQHELQLIDIVNLLIEHGALTDKFRAELDMDTTEPITVRFIRMSERLIDSLDYPSKLSRNPQHIARLVADGEVQMSAFLDRLSAAEVDQGATNSEASGQVH